MRSLWIVLVAALLAAAPAQAATKPRLTPPKALTVLEGNTVNLTIAFKTKARRTASVRFATVAGSAGIADFAARKGTLKIRKGKRSATLQIKTAADSFTETSETFRVRFSKPKNARLTRTSTTITLTDRPANTVDPVVAKFDDTTITEPATQGAAAPHGAIVTLNKASTVAVQVGYEVIHVDPANGLDVDAGPGLLIFSPGETSKAIPGNVYGDSTDEADERARIVLTPKVNVEAPDRDGFLTILDDPADVQPTVSVGDALAGEANGIVQLPITLSAPSGRQTSVAYSTADGLAKQPGDYTAASGTLIIPAGTTATSIPVQVVDDTVDEDDQAFTVTISEPGFLTLGDGQGTIIISDEDPTPTVSINDVSQPEANANATFTVTLSAVSEKQVTVKVSTTNVTAIGGATCSGVDYLTLTNLTVTITPGQLSNTFGVGVCDDGGPESSESANVTLSAPTNATLDDATGILLITDDGD